LALKATAFGEMTHNNVQSRSFKVKAIENEYDFLLANTANLYHVSRRFRCEVVAFDRGRCLSFTHSCEVKY